MRVEINRDSGFCFGVVGAIETAEEQLKAHGQLYCLGDIVHNELEQERLSQLGMSTINHEEFADLENATVLIRAHGEPPTTYETAKKNNIRLIDATCPIVLKLQKRIRKSPEESQVLIFGKDNHPEVLGLKGQIKNRVLVISGKEDLEKIDWSKPIELYSQTTKDKKQYQEIKQEIERRLEDARKNENVAFKCHNTICGSVYKRKFILADFAKKKELIIFVGGKKSSNAKVLYEVCKENNSNTKFIQGPDDIKKEWLNNINEIGIAGATSTPMWLLEKVKNTIEILSFMHEKN